METIETLKNALEAATWARHRLEQFADDAHAGLVQGGGRELKRKVWSAFSDFEVSMKAIDLTPAELPLEDRPETIDLVMEAVENIIKEAKSGKIGKFQYPTARKITSFEAMTATAAALDGKIEFKIELLPRYLARYPKILSMSAFGTDIASMVKSCHTIAVINSFESHVSQRVASQFITTSFDEIIDSLKRFEGSDQEPEVLKALELQSPENLKALLKKVASLHEFWTDASRSLTQASTVKRTYLRSLVEAAEYLSLVIVDLVPLRRW